MPEAKLSYGEAIILLREQIARVEAASALAPITVTLDAPLIVAGRQYRVIYDFDSDGLVLVPESKWRERADFLRQRLAERTSPTSDGNLVGRLGRLREGWIT